VPDNQDEHLAFVRLDQQMGSGQQLAVRYNGQRFRWHYEPGGLTLPGSGTGYRNDAQTVLATHALQLSPAVTSEWRVQFAQYVDIRRDLQSTTYVSRAGYSIEGGRIGPVGFGASPEHTWEAANTWAYATTRHSLRAGAGLNYVRAHNMALTYGHGAYFFAGSPSDYPQPFLFVQGIAPSSEAPYADPRSLSTFFFVQDDLKVRSALTLNLGLRYDVERVFAVSGYQPRVDVNNVQPRLGVAWDVGGRGRTVWRGGIGVFTQQLLLFPINRVEMEGPDGVRTITVAPDSPLMPSYPARFTSIQPGAFVPPRDLALVDASFRSPYSVQSAIGVQRVLFGNVLSVDVVRLDGRDLVSLVDVNAPASIHKPALRTVEQADATRPLVPTPGSYRKLLTLGNQGRSWYRALQVTLARRAAPVHVLASYTLSRADDMASSELPEDSRNLLAEKARSSADVRHNVTAGLTWELPGVGPLTRGWSLAGVVMLRSNRPYTITWGDDRNGTTQGDARPDGRNTGMTGPYRTVDLSLSRRFGRGPRTIDARVDAFNVFNTINYDQYVGELLSPSYGRPVSAFPQRRLQVAVVTRF
jgi:hypothetical protein